MWARTIRDGSTKPRLLAGQTFQRRYKALESPATHYLPLGSSRRPKIASCAIAQILRTEVSCSASRPFTLASARDGPWRSGARSGKAAGRSEILVRDSGGASSPHHAIRYRTAGVQRRLAASAGGNSLEDYRAEPRIHPGSALVSEDHLHQATWRIIANTPISRRCGTVASLPRLPSRSGKELLFTLSL